MKKGCYLRQNFYIKSQMIFQKGYKPRLLCKLNVNICKVRLAQSKHFIHASMSALQCAPNFHTHRSEIFTLASSLNNLCDLE